MILKKLLPHTFVGQIILLTVLPLFFAVGLSLQFFYDRHWEETGRQFARTLANQIVLIVKDTQETPTKDYPTLFKKYGKTFGFGIKFYEEAPIAFSPQHDFQTHHFRHFVRDEVPFPIFTYLKDKNMTIYAVMHHGILEIATPLSQIYQSTIHIFFAWVAGSFFLLLLLIAPFVYGQIRSLKRLTKAARHFGRGEDVPFRPSGAKEIYQAGQAFLLMRSRIKQFVDSRTQMLAAVSHDLRTPLTRMRLTLEMMGTSKNTSEIKQDIADMEKMINSYLSFARDEVKESFERMTLEAIIIDLIRDFRHQKARISVERIPSLVLRARYMDLKRALTNLIKNALHHGKKKVIVSFKKKHKSLEIIIDDDGVGIPEGQRHKMLQPFQRMDESRSKTDEGVGLGLTIAYNVIHSHAGQLKLETSPLRGLRVVVILPL
ncbi:MAG: ATP-binding protein [Alphaproteobacteria bacterium]|nr:ATP-binding protein [Alphaproteobacteria bacterium]